jgi:hypothetical protein
MALLLLPDLRDDILTWLTTDGTKAAIEVLQPKEKS